MATSNSNVRVFWIIWCSGWAFFWFVLGFVSFGIAWVMVPVSLLAILIPFGVNRGPEVVWYQQAPMTPLQTPQPWLRSAPQMQVPSAGPPAGWYADPVDPQVFRWWDGTKWTEHQQPPSG